MMLTRDGENDLAQGQCQVGSEKHSDGVGAYKNVQRDAKIRHTPRQEVRLNHQSV